MVVGTAGFEPATPCSQSRCADQAAPRPVETAAELRFLLLVLLRQSAYRFNTTRLASH
jgi:hypothetical protein